MTMDRNALGHTLVRFYLAHGSVIPFLDALTTREIYQTSECEGGGAWFPNTCVSSVLICLLFFFSKSIHSLQRKFPSFQIF